MGQTEKILGTNVGAHEKLVLVAISVERRQAAMRRLAELTSLSRSSICRALLNLEDQGKVKRIQRCNTDGGKASNRYELTI